MLSNNNIEILFLHGWGVTHHVWDDFAIGFRDQAKVLTPCLYNIAENGNDASLSSIAKIINKGLTNKTIIIAWSIGGLLALKLSGLSDKPAMIVFITSVPCFVNSDRWNNAIDKTELNKLDSMLSKDPEAALQYFSTLIAYGDASPRLTSRCLQKIMAKENQAAVLKLWLDELRQQDLRHKYSSLTIPSFVLLSEQDVLINKDIKNDLLGLNKNVPVTVLPGTGHAPFISKAKETQKLIQGYIDAGIK